jgi:hypothetical protein
MIRRFAFPLFLTVAALVAAQAWTWNTTLGCVDWPNRLASSERELTTLGTSQARFFVLADAAKSAAEVGDMAKAERYALELLDLAPCFPTDWNYGNALHDGHMVLGRVALARGDRESAKRELLEAGRTPGSPQLNSFGPNMALALDLLRDGESEVVREYFAECSYFWELGRGRLESWTAQTKWGLTPNFGANLLY